MNYDEEILQDFAVTNKAPDSAHDITHIKRVVKNARQFAMEEDANLDIVIPAAWLHDCVSVAKDSPDRAIASTLAAKKAGEYLRSIGYEMQLVDEISHAIKAHSYSANIKAATLEAKIVQDADRIDAIGAIGISRCLLVGGSLNRSLYADIDPFCNDRKPNDNKFCIDHFFTKLFTIAETMQTKSARQEANKRIAFMQLYLSELESEIA